MGAGRYFRPVGMPRYADATAMNVGATGMDAADLPAAGAAAVVRTGPAAAEMHAVPSAGKMAVRSWTEMRVANAYADVRMADADMGMAAANTMCGYGER
jgi:hypothetical protein